MKNLTASLPQMTVVARHGNKCVQYGEWYSVSIFDADSYERVLKAAQKVEREFQHAEFAVSHERYYCGDYDHSKNRFNVIAEENGLTLWATASTITSVLHIPGLGTAISKFWEYYNKEEDNNGEM